MHEELWAGVDWKIESALFHLRRMEMALNPPERSAMNGVALQASGAIIDNGWLISLYAHFDAFLSAARSVPEIIRCCFGEDPVNRTMKNWFANLPDEEKVRRRKFMKDFILHYEDFRVLLLSTTRNISQHRTGQPAVTVAVSGLFGVTYVGGRANRIPISETPDVDNPALAKLSPLFPTWGDFTIGGQPLFRSCQEYLERAQGFVEEAQRLSHQVHGTNALSLPPT